MVEGRSVVDAIVGEELEPVAFEVTREIIDMYAVAVDDRHPWYTEDSGFGGRIANPIMASTYGFRWREKHFPLLYSERGYPLQTRVDFEFVRPVKMGERLNVQGKCVERYTKRGREYVVIDHEICDEAGQLVARYKNEFILSFRKKEE